ncbi:MAG: tryptophan 2,3-dioxygenase family protein [Pseudomonadota bacterium]
MKKKDMPNCHYSDYLQLGKLLDSQKPESKRYGSEAHDETLFIIVHQAYELWFKQILHEISYVMSVFAKPSVNEEALGVVNSLLDRVITIQNVLIQQLDVMETMTPLDFLDFRDYLVPASGFQSIQFKKIEIFLGLKSEQRIGFDQESFYRRLRPHEREELIALEKAPNLFNHVNDWLERTPFLEDDAFKFWEAYHQAVIAMLAHDEEIIKKNTNLSEKEKTLQIINLNTTRHSFEYLSNDRLFEEQQQQGVFRFSHPAMLAAVFINLYRDEPIIHQPFRFLTSLVKIDEQFTTWRYRHALMVNRIIGKKIGTGGSSGQAYLQQTTENNRFFPDLFNLSTFLIPRSALPKLPETLRAKLGFYFNAGTRCQNNN